MLQHITREVIYLMMLYFALSLIMGWTISRLPVWCQSWSLTSVWGITWLVVGYTLVYPEMYTHTIRLAFIFLAAYPGMLGLEFWQRHKRLHYWEEAGAPDNLYWADKIDKVVEWWIDRRMAKMQQEAVKEAQRIAEREC